MLRWILELEVSEDVGGAGVFCFFWSLFLVEAFLDMDVFSRETAHERKQQFCKDLN